MTPPTIRAADAADGDALSRVSTKSYGDAFGHSFTPADLRYQLEQYHSPAAFQEILQHDNVLVAELAGRIVGYVQFGLCDLSDHQIATLLSECREIRRLYVLPTFQNRGIGGLLMASALAHPGLVDAPSIILDVWDQNAGAIRFYQRHGFQPIGTRVFHVPSGAPTTPNIVMRRSG